MAGYRATAGNRQIPQIRSPAPVDGCELADEIEVPRMGVMTT
jgi:hypothetical protein